MILLLNSGKPRLLDAFCGAGGAGMGYHRAGFEVTGVDIQPQKRYPFRFIQGNALEYIYKHGHEYDVIHASPPCQAYSNTRFVTKNTYPDLIAPVRELLQVINTPYVIENVLSAPLENPIMLCGTMFGLKVLRHRLFETSTPIYFAPSTCCHNRKTAKQGRPVNHESQFITVTGHFSDIEFARRAMGIEWMTVRELSQAIPPAFTEWLGGQLLKYALLKAA